ncbi:MAG: hypothetical protein WKF37_22420 [Bryobacteraceae bacterium]
MTFALMLEGEAIFLAGLALKNEFLMKLGAAILCLPLGRILLVHLPSSIRWTSAALTLAAIFAANRIAQRQAYLYSAASAALIALVLWSELAPKWITVSFALEASVLLAIGFLARDRALRLSGLFLLLFCIGKLFLWDLRELDTLSRIFLSSFWTALNGCVLDLRPPPRQAASASVNYAYASCILFGHRPCLRSVEPP